ncbi:MAG: hypothetical protein AAGA50_23825 [Pseudomonadota bacterium]
MQETATRQFILAVAAVGKSVLGAGHPLLDQIETAERSSDPRVLVEIQDAIGALPEQSRDDLLKAVHKHMREDLSMIWNQLPLGGNKSAH